MAVSLSNIQRVVAGNHRRIVGTVTGPGSYTTGGETLTAAQIRILTGQHSSTLLTSILQFDAEPEVANGRVLILDRTNLKMKFVSGGAMLNPSAALTPALVGANTTAEQSFVIAAGVLIAGDQVLGVSKPTAQAGLGIVGVRFIDATHIGITFSNNTGVGITPTAAETYQFLVFRATGAEVAAGTDLSAVACNFECVTRVVNGV